MVDIRIHSRIAPGNLPGLLGLMGKGILVPIQGNQALASFLRDRLGIDSDYLTNRIQTIFLNSQPVDNTDKACLRDGDTLALSAAMPGLVGTTFRKGGHLAEFRKRISYRREVTDLVDPFSGNVTIRLFNMIANELGPLLMEIGQNVEGRTAFSFLQLVISSLADTDVTILVDSKTVPHQSILGNDLSKEKMVRLTIVPI